ncbi:MAG: hypothetical protein ACXWKH_18685, partial [Limisphaerales bacterium]
MPGRVHSVCENGGFEVPEETRSNPLLTHGAVESLLKSSAQLLLKTKRATESNQFRWFIANPFPWLFSRSLKSICSRPGKIRCASYSVFSVIMCHAALANLQANAFVATIELVWAALR